QKQVRGDVDFLWSGLGSLCPAHHSHDAGAADFDQTEFAHQADEAVDFLRRAGDLEDEAAGRRVDGAGAEDVGKAQRLDPLFPRARDLYQRQFALDVRAVLGQVDVLVHRYQPVELRMNLVDHLRWATGDDGDPADRVILGDVGHGQAVDVVS